MISYRKNLIKKYINFLGYNVLINKKKVSKNFYTLVLKNKLVMLNIIKTVRYLEFLINFLSSQYKKKEHFLFTIPKVYNSLFKFYQSKFIYSYIDNKWSGGTLTNFLTIKRQIDIFQNYNINPAYTKKEQNLLKNKKEKFMNIFEGFSNIKKLPNIVIFLSDNTNLMAIKECISLGIIPITMLNLNKSFSLSPYIIPINQSSEMFIKFLISEIFG